MAVEQQGEMSRHLKVFEHNCFNRMTAAANSKSAESG